MKKKEKKVIIEISRNKAVKLIRDIKQEGVFFSVVFIKRTTGEIRTMVARGGVKKWVSGAGLKFDPSSRKLVGVWDSTVKDKTKAYRFISIPGLLSFTHAGIEYRIK